MSIKFSKCLLCKPPDVPCQIKKQCDKESKKDKEDKAGGLNGFWRCEKNLL